MKRDLTNLPKKESFEYYWRGVEKSAQYLAKTTSYNCPLSYEDCISEYMVAAWKSYQSFDPTQGVKFNTYAINRMHNLRKSLLNNSIKDQEKGKLPIPTDDTILQLEIESRGSTATPFYEQVIDDVDTMQTLDLIENLLFDRKDLSTQDDRAYKMFYLMRYKGYSQADCCRAFGGMSNTWLSQIFTKKVREAGNEVLVSSYNKVTRVS